METAIVGVCEWADASSTARQWAELGGLALVVSLAAALSLGVLFHRVECVGDAGEGSMCREADSSERRWRDELPTPERSTDA
jgi:hypothetical protein